MIPNRAQRLKIAGNYQNKLPAIKFYKFLYNIGLLPYCKICKRSSNDSLIKWASKLYDEDISCRDNNWKSLLELLDELHISYEFLSEKELNILSSDDPITYFKNLKEDIMYKNLYNNLLEEKISQDKEIIELREEIDKLTNDYSSEKTINAENTEYNNLICENNNLKNQYIKLESDKSVLLVRINERDNELQEIKTTLKESTEKIKKLEDELSLANLKLSVTINQDTETYSDYLVSLKTESNLTELIGSTIPASFYKLKNPEKYEFFCKVVSKNSWCKPGFTCGYLPNDTNSFSYWFKDIIINLTFTPEHKEPETATNFLKRILYFFHKKYKIIPNHFECSIEFGRSDLTREDKITILSKYLELFRQIF